MLSAQLLQFFIASYEIVELSFSIIQSVDEVWCFTRFGKNDWKSFLVIFGKGEVQVRFLPLR